MLTKKQFAAVRKNHLVLQSNQRQRKAFTRMFFQSAVETGLLHQGCSDPNCPVHGKPKSQVS